MTLQLLEVPVISTLSLIVHLLTFCLSRDKMPSIVVNTAALAFRPVDSGNQSPARPE
jgi:hypothetical protein